MEVLYLPVLGKMTQFAQEAGIDRRERGVAGKR
jgi:hypothetical protein